jgi:RHS repeat-associated protein
MYDFFNIRIRTKMDGRQGMHRTQENYLRATHGRPLAVFNYDGVGNPITETDALGRLSQNQYDAHQRQRTFIDAAQQLTQLQYDSRDNLLSVTNARSIAKWRYEYDHNGQLTKEKMPDDTALNYGYDGNGNLSQTVDAKGQTASYSYDADNRLTQAQYFSDLASAADPLNTQKTVSFSYDARDNLSAYDDGQTSASYQYDLANRLTQATVNYGAFSLTYSYTFDANGRKKTFTGPDNITYTYHYTPNGQLASVQIPGEGSYTVNQYQWLEPTQITLPGGGKHLTAYDGFMRSTQISGLDPAANAVQQDSYSYDVVDNILGRNSLEGIYNFGYDTVDRLQSVASELENNAFTYDGVGNRLSEAQITDPENNPATWEYDNNDRLTQRGSITYDYDANGSLIKKTNTETNEETRYTYNLENRLTEIRDGANVLIASYAYDPFGRRISKTINATTTYYLYSEEGLIAEADAIGSITTSYLYQTHQTWSTDPLLIRQNGQVGYYHNDHLGTPQLITAKSGAVLWKATYTAFGKATVTTNTMTNNLRFPGQYYDGETGTHYNYFRDYDPETGRYLQSDPIGLMGGVNAYAYVLGNPINFSDMFGLVPDCKIVKIFPTTTNKYRRSATELSQRFRSMETEVVGYSAGALPMYPRNPRLLPSVSPIIHLWLIEVSTWTKTTYERTTRERITKYICTETIPGECGNTRERVDFQEVIDVLDDSGEKVVDQNTYFTERRVSRLTPDFGFIIP